MAIIKQQQKKGKKIMEVITNIFQSVAFPVAMCIVLIYACMNIIKRELRQNDDAQKLITDANERHTNYLQAQNERLTVIISENTKAFNTLISLLEEIKNVIK